jgi:hypothetical protein
MRDVATYLYHRTTQIQKKDEKKDYDEEIFYTPPESLS